MNNNLAFYAELTYKTELKQQVSSITDSLDYDLKNLRKDILKNR